MGLRKVGLYGGSITCKIPLEFEDLSQFLPVNDNQEVYVYHVNRPSHTNQGLSSYDIVLSFEILQYLSGHDDATAGRKLFEDLSLCNESRNSKMETLNLISGVTLGLKDSFNSVSVSGTMEISRSKFKKEDYHTVNVLMYNVRMARYNCEFMVSYSYPANSGAFQSNHQKAFEDIVGSLRVVNTGLFVV